MATPTHYRRSNGDMAEIAAMPTRYLANAIRKLQREEPHRTDELAAMTADHAARDDKGDFPI